MLCGVIIVSILEGRHLVNEIPKSDLQTVKITFEKLVNSKNFGGFQKATLNKDDIKSILNELLADDEAEKPEKEFTEKDK